MWLSISFMAEIGADTIAVMKSIDWLIDFWCFTPLSAVFQLYHGDQFQWWKKPEYPERTTDHGQATGKLYHLRLRVECTLICNLQSQALLGKPTT